MEPWVIGLLVQGVIQLSTVAVLAGIMWNKLAHAAIVGERTQDLVQLIRVAMATADAECKEVSVHVGDLEIRVRRLEHGS